MATKCPRCESRKGKRHCPALGVHICARCCGEGRLREIHCPEDCRYLEAEDYHQERRKLRAGRAGGEILEWTAKLFRPDGDTTYPFVMTLQSDVYAFLSLRGPVADADVAAALEDVAGRLSPIVVSASGLRHPLAEYLLGRVETSERYRYFKDLDARTRAGLLEELAKGIARLRDPDGHAYHRLLAAFFDQVSLEVDFEFSEEDALALRGAADDEEGGGFHRSASGLILPR